MFIAGKIAFILVKPSTLLLVALVLGAATAGWRWGRVLLVTTVACLVLIPALQLGSRAMLTLEGLYANVPLPASVDGIVVLGGRGVKTIDTADLGQFVIDEGIERQLAPVFLMERYPDAQLVFTGGGGPPGEPHLTEAAGVKDLWAELGLKIDEIVFEDRSKDTHTNALYTYELVQPDADETWLLVTSGFHMWRSLATFRSAGWPVVPHSVDLRVCGRRSWLNLPAFDLPGELSCLDLAFHEVVGFAYYKSFGRIDDWAPLGTLPELPDESVGE